MRTIDLVRLLRKGEGVFFLIIREMLSRFLFRLGEIYGNLFSIRCRREKLTHHHLVEHDAIAAGKFLFFLHQDYVVIGVVEDLIRLVGDLNDIAFNSGLQFKFKFRGSIDQRLDPLGILIEFPFSCGTVSPPPNLLSPSKKVLGALRAL